MTVYRIQYASRFLLNDFGRNYFSEPWNKLITPVKNADMLILCGDIGFRQALHTREFIQYCSLNWPRIVWIKGALEMEINRDGSSPFARGRGLPDNVEYVDKEGWVDNVSNIYAIPFGKRVVYSSPQPQPLSRKDTVVASYSQSPPQQWLQPNIWIQGIQDCNISEDLPFRIACNMRFSKKGVINNMYSPECSVYAGK